MKSEQELKALHGQAYVDAFNSGQSPMRLERLLARIALDPAADIVDYGCGNGLLMQHLAPRVHSYTGVDFSEPFIAAARARQQALHIGNAVFACEDIQRFAASHAAQFDAAFAMDFSEHVYDADWLVILRSIRSTLKAGGVFYLHTPNLDFLIERMKQHGILLRQFPEHIAVRTPEHNMRLLHEAGFTAVTVSLIAHYNILQLLHPLSFLPWIGKYFKARIFIQAQ